MAVCQDGHMPPNEVRRLLQGILEAGETLKTVAKKGWCAILLRSVLLKNAYFNDIKPKNVKCLF